jgi:aspartyl-tRNA(Asn)/glutamyl-tRNA(Gln) amidotransferase subunit A
MADLPPDFAYFSVSRLTELLRARQISSVDLTRAFLERLERLGPRYNALALSLGREAVAQAKEVDGDLKRGRYRSAVQGIPFAVKDLLAVKGHPTTWGAKPTAAQVFDYDATVVTRLRKAGAILIGKLAMVQLAGGGGYRTAQASLFGAGLNPWDRSRWSGGSSSGSGSAVAAGLVPFAIGSETSGSIITPAAFCGITGLRPTYGLVSRFGAMPLSWTMDKLGPMARSAEDCGMILQVIAGKDEQDPGTLGKSFYYTPQYGRPIKEIKVGYNPADFEGWPDPECRKPLLDALAAFRSLGTQMIETQLPDMPYGPVTNTIITSEGASVFEPWIRDGRIDQLTDPWQIAGLRSGLDITAADYLKAMRIRRLIQQGIRKVMTDVDVLLAPARYSIAPKVTQRLDLPTSKIEAPPTQAMRALIPAGNLAGLPGLSVPCGFAEGLPVGLQIVGRPLSENLLLTLGVAFQKATDWHTKHPNLGVPDPKV